MISKTKVLNIVLAFMLAILCLGSARTVSAGYDTWTSIGPWGGTITALAIDPKTPTTLYAGTNWMGIYKSTDGGASWATFENAVSKGYVQSLVVDPLTPTILYTGIYKSTDGAVSWFRNSNSSRPTEVVFLAIDPLTPTTLYAIDTYDGLYKSSNGGESWTLINPSTPNSPSWPRVLALDSQTPTTLYTAVDGGIYKSTNEGKDWVSVGTLLPSAIVSALAVDPVTPSTLYAGSYDNGLYKSTDGGATWAAANTGLLPGTIYRLVINPLAPSSLYAVVSDKGIFKSTNGGASWSASSAGLPSYALNPWSHSLVMDSSEPATLYAGTERGVFKSTDSGASWRASSTGLSTMTFTALVVDPLTPSKMYAVGPDDSIFKSANGGKDWTASKIGEFPSYGYPIYGLVIDPLAPKTFYALTSYGPYKSTDGSETWTRLDVGAHGQFVNQLVIDPLTPSTLYAVMDAEGEGIYKSTDGGANWKSIYPGYGFWHLAIDPHTPSTLYASFYTYEKSSIIKTTNGGKTWVNLPSGTIMGCMITNLVVDPLPPTTLYLDTNHCGIRKSTDDGITWSPITTNPPGTFEYDRLIVDPRMPGTLYTQTSAGFFRSTDGGASWLPFGAGLAYAWVNALAFDPKNPAILYAATDRGLNVMQQIPPLTINYPNGTPGSAFSVSGTQFPPNSSVIIAVNGSVLGSVQADSTGSFTVILQTSANTQAGFYAVTATTSDGASARTQFYLVPGLPARAQDGTGTVLSVPDGIAYSQQVHLSQISR